MRFTQPDTLVPQPGNPQSLNRYAYVLNNPLKYTDPTGHCIDTDWDCLAKARELFELYGITIEGIWSTRMVQVLEDTSRDIALRFGATDLRYGQSLFRSVFGGTTVRLTSINFTTAGYDRAFTHGNMVDLPSTFFYNRDEATAKLILAHELGHIWDTKDVPLEGVLGGNTIARQMMRDIGAEAHCWPLFICSATGYYDPGEEDPVGGPQSYAASSPNEDWAESFAAWVYKQPLGPRRHEFVERQLALLVSPAPLIPIIPPKPVPGPPGTPPP